MTILVTKDKIMWKECNVVMLPSKQKATIVINPSTNKVQYHNTHFNADYYTDAGFKVFDLYVVSGEKIKEGDWVYDIIANKLHVADEGIVSISQHNNRFQKIIATTDISLKLKEHQNGCMHDRCLTHTCDGKCRLPSIPQSFITHFINEYNKGTVIDKVIVEYEEYDHDEEWSDIGGAYETCKERVKLNPDNTINIKPYKDSYTREDMINFANRAIYDFIGNANGTVRANLKLDAKWIENNL